MEAEMEWDFEKRKIGELHENEDNPRTMSRDEAERLQTSLGRFGLCEPIVVNRSGEIIGGHQRYRILKALGRKTINVSVPPRDLEEEEARELCILLNKLSGSWDNDMLANRWDMDTLLKCGFTEKDLGIEPSEEESPEKKITFTVTCPDTTQVSDIKEMVSGALANFLGVTYKVKVK
jgi:hypothetical protein